jgi:membrane fusion protein (multidrug efflux system)
VNPDDVRDLYLSFGKILTILVKEGDPVRAGQVLAIMDPDAKKVELAQCESNIVRLEQELAQKKLEGYSLAGIQVKEADLKTEYSRRNLLQKELRELTVTAPINGRVSLLLLKAGDYVDPDAPRLGQIVNDALLTVEAEVPAEDAIKIKPDDSAEIRVATIREPYPAKVIQVLPPIKKASSSFSNPRVKLALQPGVQLIPGTSVRVRIRIDRAKLAVTVPVEAIYEETIVQKGDRDYFAVRPASGKIRKYVYVLKDCS